MRETLSGTAIASIRQSACAFVARGLWKTVECAGIHGHLRITKAQFFEDSPPACNGSLFREEPLTIRTSEKARSLGGVARKWVDDASHIFGVPLNLLTSAKAMKICRLKPFMHVVNSY